MTEPTKRRSRMRARAKHERVELTERDLEIFKLLTRYRYLRSNFLHAFIGGNKTRFIERLGKLYHEGLYINRPKEQWQFANARYMPAIYELGPKGEAALIAAGVKLPGNVLLKKGRMGDYRQFAHALMTCDILASIELGIRADPKLRFISWQDILAKAPAETLKARNPFEMPVRIAYTFPGTDRSVTEQTKVLPDGLFGIRYIDAPAGKDVRFYAIEADRATMPIRRSSLKESSVLRKVLSYREVAKGTYKAHFGIPNLLVLTVTTGKQHMESMVDLVKELAPQGSKVFLFKTMSTLGDFGKAPSPTPHILTAPWQRAGESDFNISKA